MSFCRERELGSPCAHTSPLFVFSGTVFPSLGLYRVRQMRRTLFLFYFTCVCKAMCLSVYRNLKQVSGIIWDGPSTLFRRQVPSTKPRGLLYFLRLEWQGGCPTLGVNESSEQPNSRLHSFSASALVAKLSTQPRTKMLTTKHRSKSHFSHEQATVSLVSNIRR